MYTNHDEASAPKNGFNGIEKLNRQNFRACLEAISRPGTRHKIYPLFDSSLLALASVLLYAEVSYYYRGRMKDFELIKAMTGARPGQPDSCDYLFADQPSGQLLTKAYPGTMDKPETSATCIFFCPAKDYSGTEVLLSGPGIDKVCKTVLPCDRVFTNKLIEQQHPFPQGVDIYCITSDNYLIGLPRTTKVMEAQ